VKPEPWDNDDQQEKIKAERSEDLRTLCQEFSACFCDRTGREVLRHLRFEWGIEHNIDPEEEAGRPMDPLLLAKRRGLQAAYWTIINYVRQGMAYDRNEDKESHDERLDPGDDIGMEFFAPR